MRKFIVVLMTSAVALSAGYSFAQSGNDTNDDAAVSEMAKDTPRGSRFNREPVDIERFSRLDDLKAADANGDGTLSREELEAHAMARIVKRMADRMERRLDVDGDGTVTIAEVEKHRGKQFAALDRNEDGTLDRREMREAKQFRGHGQRHERHGRPGHHRDMRP